MTFQWTKKIRKLIMKKNILRKHNLPYTQNWNLGTLGYFFTSNFERRCNLDAKTTKSLPRLPLPTNSYFSNLFHSFIFQRSFSKKFVDLLLLEKATKTHNFANTFYTLYCECILYYRSKHKHKKSCFVNARILESFYKKGKTLRKKMKKWQIENSEKSEILKISKKVFWVFLFQSFRFWPAKKIENSDLKILENNFRDFRDLRVFWVFDLACFDIKFNVFRFWCHVATFYEHCMVRYFLCQCNDLP